MPSLDLKITNLEKDMAAVLKAVHTLTDSQNDSKTEAPIEPYIEDLLPWLRNIDKRRIGTCQGCGLSFIGNQVGQKTCSNICRNKAWKESTAYKQEVERYRK
jgi:hypothetical protein